MNNFVSNEGDPFHTSSVVQACSTFFYLDLFAGCHQIYTSSWRCEWQVLIDRSQSMDVLSVNSRKNGGCAKIEEDQKSNCTYYIRSFPKSAVDPVQKSWGFFYWLEHSSNSLIKVQNTEASLFIWLGRPFSFHSTVTRCAFRSICGKRVREHHEAG